MKKYFLKMTALVLLMGTIASCSEDKVYYDGSKGASLVSLPETSGSLAHTPTINTREITVNVSSVSDVDRTINVVVDQTASDATNYTLDPVVIIPKGSYQGKIKVITNDAYDAEKIDAEATKLVFNLEKQDANDKSIHLEPKQSHFELAIFTTCDYDAKKVSKSYVANVKINSTTTVVVPPSYDVKLTARAGDDRLFSIPTLWGPDFVYTVTGGKTPQGQYPAAGTIRIKPDMTLEIESEDYITEANGTYDPCKDVFVYTLSQNLFSNSPFSVTVTLTPKN